jgi:hypothetical protein
MTLTTRSASLGILLGAAAVVLQGCAERRGNKMKGDLKHVDVIPGRSIGSVVIGTPRKDLPNNAIFEAPGGVVDGIHFLVSENDVIEDIWIEDIRTFADNIYIHGKAVPRNASVEQIEGLIGKCTRISGRKGGIFFNCVTGISLGIDFEGKALQLRVKPIADPERP